MFILCPHCQFLVALEPVTGQPPKQCPRCGEHLHPIAQSAPATGLDAVVETESTDVPTHSEAGPVVADEGATLRVAAEGDDPQAPMTLAENPAPVAREAGSDAGVDGTADAAAAAVIAGPESLATTAISQPSPPRRRIASASARHRIAMASIPVLVLVLLLQSLLSDRARLAADARWRPVMIALCDVLPCTLPPWREPTAFTLLERDVRPDPRRPGVLHVSAGFRNDARWPQPWPALLLTLSDADGRVAGERAFRPEEYLVAPATKNGLASGQSAKVSFDVVEPTRDVVAFTFDFR